MHCRRLSLKRRIDCGCGANLSKEDKQLECNDQSHAANAASRNSVSLPLSTPSTDLSNCTHGRKKHISTNVARLKVTRLALFTRILLSESAGKTHPLPLAA
jgi:hypothetical protein